MNIEETIKKWVLQNAVKYEGKANPGAIVGKLISEHPEFKDKIKDLMPKIQKIVKEINSLKLEKQLEELKKIAPELLEEKPKEQRVGLKPLPNAEQNKVVMRFAPSPSGALHIGRTIVLALNYAYCKMYNGKMILRIEDTDPEKIFLEAYKLIEEDCQWITSNGISEVVVQSDRLGIYYDHAERLIATGKAYVCTCNADFFRELINQKKACPCRDIPKQDQLIRWAKMFNEFKPGDAVVRIKTSISDPNPAMRDWPALRINDSHHVKKGSEVKVWPLMNFSVAIDDHELGITHTIRGKDHIDNEKRQKILFDYFQWKIPTHLYIGRINFSDLELSSSKTKLAIERGEYSGWDDIRLPFIRALKRRGYQPLAFIKFAEQVGVNENDKTVSKDEFFKNLDSLNKEIIDPTSNRYFFILDPVKVCIENSPERKVELKLHPSHPEKGARKFSTKQKFYLCKNDVEKLVDKKLYRLMDCLNFKKSGKKFIFDSVEHEHYKEHGEMIMHWLPAEHKTIAVEILMPDKEVVKGLGEEGLDELKEGTIVQFERFGFCKLDKKEKNKLIFWFTHK